MLTGLLSWSHRAALSYREVEDSNVRYNLALEAEDALGDVVVGLGHLADSIHLRKRIYVPEQQRSREIDVVAVTNCIYVVEVKNWAGKVWSNNGKWYQLPPRQNARALEFDDVLDECEFKARALVRTLMRSGVEVPPGSVKAIVVFANPKVVLDPATVGKHPSVFTKKQFQATVEPRNWSKEWLTWAAPAIFLGRAEIPPQLRTKVNDVLSKVRTWDGLIMHNGERLQGDLKWIKLPEYTAWQHVRDREQGLNVQRKDIDDVSLSWASPSWYGAFGAMWQGAAGVLTLRVDKRYPLAPCGQNKKDRSKGPKSSQRADASMDAPREHVIHLSTKSTHRQIIEVNHVVFQPAGQRGPAVYPLSQIAKLELSANADRVASVTQAQSAGSGGTQAGWAKK